MPTITIQCSSCKGTGLYRGRCERGGAAVVCRTCEGMGQSEYTYQEFSGRKRAEGVTRVYQGAYGYVISARDAHLEDGEIIRFSQFGCTYDEWKNRAVPRHIEDLYCPYMAHNRGKGHEPLDRCRRECTGWGMISNCAVYKDKKTCWELYHAQQQQGGN